MTSKYSYHDSGSISNFDFYSGSQVSVWFGDVMIDDINSIQWSRNQNKRPIYGYASQQFDAVAKGTVLIQGNFTINFRQKGYLSAILDSIKRLYEYFQAKMPYDPEEWKTVKKLLNMHLKNGTFGPMTVEEIKGLGGKQNFLEEAKMYEDIIWGGAGNVEKDFTMDAPDVAQTDLIPDGFNILITYGNLSSTGPLEENDYMRSTVKSLSNVHIMGESQVIQVGGQPVMEQYEFIARGTDESLGTNRRGGM